jgi:hypothetical protein
VDKLTKNSASDKRRRIRKKIREHEEKNLRELKLRGE